MAKRFRDTSKSDREWYMNLRPRLKCAVDYLHDKCDNAGVWLVNMKMLNNTVNDVKKIDLEEILKVDGGNQFVEFEKGKIYCAGFIQFQYGSLSENCKPHLSIISLLKKYNLFERVSKGYPKGMHTLKEEDKEEDKEKEMEKEKKRAEAKNEKPEMVFPFSSPEFLYAWSLWKQFKKEQFDFTYKSHLSEQAALSELATLSNENEVTALAVIHQSIAKGWQGLFKLKNHSNGTHQSVTDYAADIDRAFNERFGAVGKNGTYGN